MTRVVACGCVRKDDSLRSRNVAGAIQRVDFQPRVLVVRSTTDVSCRVADVAPNQQIVDTGSKGQEQRPRSGPGARRAQATTRVAGKSRSDRERQPYRRTPALFAQQLHPAAVHMNDVAADSEAETAPMP